MESADAKDLIRETELYLQAQAAGLDYDKLYFVLKKVKRPDTGGGPGYVKYLFYNSVYGYSAPTDAEIKHAINEGNLQPGDITISAYYLNGPDGPICASAAKVLEFEDDGITPKELFHFYPLEYERKAIDPSCLKNRNIKDKR